ncbi:MAG: hypothetical protein ACOY4Q_12755 [Bacillota bacterium]
MPVDAGRFIQFPDGFCLGWKFLKEVVIENLKFSAWYKVLKVLKMHFKKEESICFVFQSITKRRG